MTIRKVVTKHVAGNPANHVGRSGDLWFDDVNDIIRFGNGSTPGGVPISSGSSEFSATLPTVEFTGPWKNLTIINTSPPRKALSLPDQTNYDLSGIITSRISVEEPEITSLSIDDLDGTNGDLYITDCPLLTSLSFNALSLVFGELYFNNLPALETLSVPLLRFAEDGINIYDTNLTTVSFPELVETDNVTVEGSQALTSISLPKLKKMSGSLNLYNCDSMINYTLPELEICDGIYVYDSAELQEINLPKLRSADSISVENVPNLVSFSLGTSLKEIRGSVNIINTSLSQASVDGVLTALANLDGTNGTTVFEQENVNINGGNTSIPSQVGLDAIAVLESRGCNVQVVLI